MRDLGQSFARHLRAERRSPGTLRLYGQSVEFLCPAATTTANPKPLSIAVAPIESRYGARSPSGCTTHQRPPCVATLWHFTSPGPSWA